MNYTYVINVCGKEIRMRLINGDSTEEVKKIESDHVDCIITDPPYGVDFKAHYDDSAEYVFSQIDGWFKEWYRVLKDDKFLFIFAPSKELHQWIQAGIAAGFTFKNILATRSFNNGSPAPKNNFGFQFQPVLVFAKGKGRKFNEVDFIPTSKEWFKDKRNKNPRPFTYSYPNWIKTEWAFATEKRASKNLHPNEKNVKLIEFLVKLTTEENEIVLDSFMGCGSTGQSCRNTNRDFIGIELDEGYYDNCVERLKER